MPTNRLINERSPYLLQHAHNPVDWYAWGEDAFRKAREENKPIFLSIGYATCHWCHVMERESFDNKGTAEALNRDFVSIKVDREERPDVDRIYMLFLQAATGGGGWPMSVFLTPDLKPFFGGTYFPPEPRHGLPAFTEVLQRVADVWRKEQAQVIYSSADIIEQLTRHSQLQPVIAPVNPQVLDSGFYAFRRQFDTAHGGFGTAPKFPRVSVLDFLLRYHRRTGNVEALEMVFATLNAMAHGGIHDHLGGGFHRYSVDERWFVPHFEKMLYDQAQIAASYIEAFKVSNDAYYADVARATLDYVLRDLADPGGGFCCAEDADSPDPANPSHKREGAFYLWTADEIRATLGEPASARFMYQYGVQERGNVFYDPGREFAGRNILFEAHSVQDTARHFELDVEEMARSLAESRAALLAARNARPRPLRDDKV
ncbi:MAG: thioredoxin domain-containing protein, partial [bacterium]